MSRDITDFENATAEDLDDIDTTLLDLAKLDGIIQDVTALDASLNQAHEEIADTNDTVEGKNTMNMALIIIVMILGILMLFMFLRGGGGRASDIPMEAEPQPLEPIEPVDIETREIFFEKDQ